MTDKEVAALIEEFRVPLHVRRHCAAVANFAFELGEKCIVAGEKIDLTLLRHSALLHDFVRVVDFRIFEPSKFPDPAAPSDIALWKELRKKYSGMHHADAGAEILESRGYHDVARLVRKHRFLQIIDGLDTWEEKLLFYADKRAKHDKIVPLHERLADGKLRNSPETGAVESAKLNALVEKLEQEIITKIGSKT